MNEHTNGSEKGYGDSSAEKSLKKREVEIANQHLISVKDFVDSGYAEKIANGECEVFEVLQPPDENASPSEKAAWQYMLMAFGNGMRINEIQKVGDDYYNMSGLRVRGSHPLVVFTKAK